MSLNFSAPSNFTKSDYFMFARSSVDSIWRYFHQTFQTQGQIGAKKERTAFTCQFKKQQIHSFGLWENLQRDNLLAVLSDL